MELVRSTPSDARLDTPSAERDFRAMAVEDIFANTNFLNPQNRAQIAALFAFPIDKQRQHAVDSGYSDLALTIKVPSAYHSPQSKEGQPTLYDALQTDAFASRLEALRQQAEDDEHCVASLVNTESEFIIRLQQALAQYFQVDKKIYPDEIKNDGVMNCTARAALVHEFLERLQIPHLQVDIPGKYKHTVSLCMLADGKLIWLDPGLRPDMGLANQILAPEDFEEGTRAIEMIQNFVREKVGLPALSVSLASHSKAHHMMSWLPKELVHNIYLLDAQTATRQMFLSADGWILDQNGDSECAADSFRASMAYDTPNANPYCGYADVSHKLKKDQEAALAYLFASQLDETQGYACYRLAGRLSAMKMYPQAKKYFEIAISRTGLNGSRSDAHLELAQTLLYLGEIEDANSHFQMAWKLACQEADQLLKDNDLKLTDFPITNAKIINYHIWMGNVLSQNGHFLSADQFNNIGKQIKDGTRNFRNAPIPTITLTTPTHSTPANEPLAVAA